MALAITRRHKQSVRIGDEIKITILQKRPGSPWFRLIVDAPKGIAVHREEVWRAINMKDPDREDGTPRDLERDAIRYHAKKDSR